MHVGELVPHPIGPCPIGQASNIHAGPLVVGRPHHLDVVANSCGVFVYVQHAGAGGGRGFFASARSLGAVDVGGDHTTAPLQITVEVDGSGGHRGLLGCMSSPSSLNASGPICSSQ